MKNIKEKLASLGIKHKFYYYGEGITHCSLLFRWKPYSSASSEEVMCVTGTDTDSKLAMAKAISKLPEQFKSQF